MDYDISFASAHDFLLAYFQIILIFDKRILEIEPEAVYKLPKDHRASVDCLCISVHRFVTASSVLANAVSDYDCMQFSNSVLAAAVFFHFYRHGTIEICSNIFPSR